MTAPNDTREDYRDPACVKRWPDCWPGEFDPRCCRFPKSCSCTVVDGSLAALSLPAAKVAEAIREELTPVWAPVLARRLAASLPESARAEFLRACGVEE